MILKWYQRARRQPVLQCRRMNTLHSGGLQSRQCPWGKADFRRSWRVCVVKKLSMWESWLNSGMWGPESRRGQVLWEAVVEGGLSRWEGGRAGKNHRWEDSCLEEVALCGWQKMTGIKVVVRLIILEATGPVSVADSVSHWFLNAMLLRIPFETNAPWMMCWNGERRRDQLASRMFHSQWNRSPLWRLRQRYSMENLGKELKILRQNLPHTVGKQLKRPPHACLLMESWLVEAEAASAALLGSGTLTWGLFLYQW